MGWSDAKIRKVFALLGVAIWLFLVVAWRMGKHGTIPIDGWTISIMGVLTVYLLWRAFRKQPGA